MGQKDRQFFLNSYTEKFVPEKIWAINFNKKKEDRGMSDFQSAICKIHTFRLFNRTENYYLRLL